MTTVCNASRVKLYRDRRELVKRIAELDQDIANPQKSGRRAELKALQYSMSVKLDAIDEYLHEQGEKP